MIPEVSCIVFPDDLLDLDMLFSLDAKLLPLSLILVSTFVIGGELVTCTLTLYLACSLIPVELSICSIALLLYRVVGGKNVVNDEIFHIWGRIFTWSNLSNVVLFDI